MAIRSSDADYLARYIYHQLDAYRRDMESKDLSLPQETQVEWLEKRLKTSTAQVFRNECEGVLDPQMHVRWLHMLDEIDANAYLRIPRLDILLSQYRKALQRDHMIEDQEAAFGAQRGMY